MPLEKRTAENSVATYAASRISNKFGRVFLAFILRDMRTRFGRSYISYIVSVGWPLSHLLVMFGAYVLTHKIAPIGDDPSMFAFTGLAPYILCLYPARFTAFAVIQNKPLLQFPIATPIHLIFSRVALECLSALVVFMLFYMMLTLLGVASEPSNIYLASAAIAATLYLSIGLGVFVVIICAYQPFFGVLFVVFLALIMYLASGALAPFALASGQTTALLSLNPLYNIVGLLRSSYYSSYDQHDYSIYYVIIVASMFLLMGLLGERVVRGKLRE